MKYLRHSGSLKHSALEFWAFYNYLQTEHRFLKALVSKLASWLVLSLGKALNGFASTYEWLDW